MLWVNLLKFGVKEYLNLISHTFLPVENIVSQAIIVHDVFHDEEVLIVIPVIST